MARNPRLDDPGSWHHVMNRGIARRTLFETAADIRFFLSRLARAVRRGHIEVHAYSILTTHFHLLVRSPRGRLSLAQVALLRDLCACSFAEIGSRIGVSAPHASRTYGRHHRFLDEPAYAERVSELAARALALQSRSNSLPKSEHAPGGHARGGRGGKR